MTNFLMVEKITIENKIGLALIGTASTHVVPSANLFIYHVYV